MMNLYFRSFLNTIKIQKITVAPINRATDDLKLILVIRSDTKSIEKPITANGLFNVVNSFTKFVFS